MTSLPLATGTTLGGVIVGSGVNVAPDGTISVTHFSGDYNDLINKPIVAAPVQSDWNSAGGDSYILNKPVALSQFSNDLKISDFPNDALYTTVPQAASAAPIQSIVAGANVAISNDGHGNITIASTGTGSGTGGGIASVSGSAPIKVVAGTTAPVISLNVGAGLKVASGILTVSDATVAAKGIVQLADATAINAGTAGRVVDAAQLKAAVDPKAPLASPTFTGLVTAPNLHTTGKAVFLSAGNDVPLTIVNTGTGHSFIVQDEASDSSPFLIDSVGRVAIGHTTPTSLVELRAPTATPPQLRITSTGTAGTSASPVSRGSIAFPNSTVAREMVTLTSIGREANYLGGMFQISVANTSGTSESVFTIDNQANAATFGVRTTLPLYVPSLTSTGVITVSATSGSAGSYLPSVCFASDANTGLGQVGGSDSVSLITAGSERVRVTATGNIGIGSSGNNTTRFLLGGDVSGAGTNFCFLASPTAQPAVKTLYGCMTFPSVASGCVLNDLYHYAAQQGATHGTISTQVGYWAHSGLTSAAINIAFRADIASGTGRWNFFANGTAANYFAGNVGIGSNATLPTAALDIDSDTIRLRTARTPASASAAGNAGDICWDANYLYICIAPATWHRVAHSTW